MAKGARASSKKRNHANLRTKVFAPVYDARTERLSAKLQEIANAPKPEQEKKMDVENEKVENASSEDAAADAPEEEAMQWTGLTSNRKTKSRKFENRISKISKRKPKNQIVFPSEMARKKRQAKDRKS